MSVLEKFKLDGKVAIVTGGGRGLGKAIAIALGEAGADITVSARTKKQIEGVKAEIEGLGRNALSIQTDVRVAEQVEDMVERTVSELGRVDILVNNAGIGGYGWLTELSEDSWHNVLDTNLTSTFLCTRAVGKHLTKQNSGKIINISSAAGIVGAPRQAHYHSSKAGVILFTKALALEWNRFNINVNAIAPGYFLTNLTKPMTMNKKYHQEMLKKIPLRRLGDPEEIGPLAVYLASDASSYMTGETIVIDGGVTTY
ncbi:MAG: 3-oxoacyl-ACP reductase family protein [Halobacteriota archaeon]|nr:3-oxoacyl-ACP reductase family protein [Halobacteriota archaeon]